MNGSNMEEREKYQTGQDDTAKTPKSVLHITFSAPGSAQIVEIGGEGVIGAEQLGAAALLFLARLLLEWIMPEVRTAVREVVSELLAEQQ